MKLKELMMTDFQEGKKYDFIFPLGATEQHGPFLPFGTDTYITEYLVEQVSKEFPEIIILPTLEFSRSQEHRGFYGSLWLTEETLERVMRDICNSIKDRVRHIFITSFHANGAVIRRFIENNSFPDVSVIYLEITHEDDDVHIQENILNGPIDGHAGNSEISNMLVIDERLVQIPPHDYPKFQVENPWETDNLIEKCPNGIEDNHPEWIISQKIGQDILDIYVKRMVSNLKDSLKNNK